MKFEKTDVWGFEHAIRGMRNPKESWDRSDSHYEYNIFDMSKNYYCIGKKDLELMQILINAGSEHRKFIRQIMVSVDITAPIYWWKEFDTYKIGTVADSTSTMHKLAETPIKRDCFEHPDLVCGYIIEMLENLRLEYLEKKDFLLWEELNVNLPVSWLQTRTVTMNYENVLNMIHQRKNHKLTEWSVDFIEWARSLPYAEELLFQGVEK